MPSLRGGGQVDGSPPASSFPEARFVTARRVQHFCYLDVFLGFVLETLSFVSPKTSHIQITWYRRPFDAEFRIQIKNMLGGRLAYPFSFLGMSI